MTERKPTIDYVVVAFRSEALLPTCLDAIEADRPTGAGIIVVDNDSPDCSAAVAARHRSQPRVKSNAENIGFGRACNQAVESSSADLVFFVNPDARVRRGTTERLAARMAADGSLGATGPRIVDPQGELRAASAGFEPSLTSALGHFLLLARLPLLGRFFPPFQLPGGRRAQEVDWVSGAAMVVRTSAFRTIGGFDPAIFLYLEDVDLCRRLRAKGSTVWYEPSAVVEHDLGGSQGGDQPVRWYRALHGYVASRRGVRYARVFSAVAALGLGLRTVALLLRSPAHARRLAKASATATSLALARPGTSSD